jgi:putative oxidoreductase
MREFLDSWSPRVLSVLRIVTGFLMLWHGSQKLFAFLLSGTMAVAYWMAHGLSGKGFLPLLNGGELAALYTFVFLYFVFAGPGPWSVDSLFGKGRAADAE